MLTDREMHHLDRQFEGFIKSICECFNLSKKEALREIELRVNLMKAKNECEKEYEADKSFVLFA